MLSILKKSITTTILFFFFDLCAQDLKTTFNEEKYNLSICAIFKNESEYLREWIEYHTLIGVDHFFLYNVGSTDDFRAVLYPYIKKGLVTLIDWIECENLVEEKGSYCWSLSVQIPAYENAIQSLTLGKTKWLTFVNIHEYLVSPVDDCITDILEEYKEDSGIALKCDFFDASKNSHLLPKRKLLIQTLELSQPLIQNPQREIAKIIFKPEHCKGFTWPPYRCLFKNFKIAQEIHKSKLRINHYMNRDRYSPFKRQKEKFPIVYRTLSEEEMTQILLLDYEIEDPERAISRFIPELAKKMGYNLEWGW